MKKILISTIIIFTVISLTAQVPSFGPRENRGLIELDEIDEASGLAASKKNINVLWTHNDSGDSARIFAINSSGKHLGIFRIANTVNRDWEDIAIGPGPVDGEDYIYIAEIGDNNAQYALKYIYRVPEPEVDANQEPVYIALENAQVIKFRYPDGQRDAETIFVDPLTKDIYIVSKRENNVMVYLASYPQSLIDTLILENIATLPLTQITAGDISNDGTEILLKNYDSVFYWHRNPGQTIAETFNNNTFYVLPYLREPQGEGICWSYNADGYYTISEEPLNIPAYLYFYPRISTDVEDSNDEGFDFHLEQNYPNPFNPDTNIKFAINSRQFATLKVFDALGKEIATLVNEEKPEGNYEILFNASNLSSGIYFYKLQTEGFVQTKAMTLLK